MNPRALTIPAPDPIIKATAGEVMRSADDPIATPPARVAFRTTSISNALSNNLETPHAVMQLAEMERTVFTITLC
jgi:hypothetical protein